MAELRVYLEGDFVAVGYGQTGDIDLIPPESVSIYEDINDVITIYDNNKPNERHSEDWSDYKDEFGVVLGGTYQETLDYLTNLVGSVSVNRDYGWQDFADDGTSEGSPIQQTNVLGGSVQLTNNNQGVLTDGNTNLNSVTTLTGVTDLLDSTTGTLEFSNRGLKVNDTFLMRSEVNVSVNTIPSQLFIDLDFYDSVNGTGNLQFSQSTELMSINDTAGVFKNDSVLMSFFLGESIKEGSCKISLRGTTAFDVEVIGYNIQIHRK